MLPGECAVDLAAQVRHARQRHASELRRAGGLATLPEVVLDKMLYAADDWRWQFVFPSDVQPPEAGGRPIRWHADPSTLDRKIAQAARDAGLTPSG